MDEDARSLKRCVTCNHLEELHGGGGCLVMDLANLGPDKVPLTRCFCVHPKGSVPIYMGAPTYLIAEPVKISIQTEFDENEGFFDPNGFWHKY